MSGQDKVKKNPLDNLFNRVVNQPDTDVPEVVAPDVPEATASTKSDEDTITENSVTNLINNINVGVKQPTNKKVQRSYYFEPEVAQAIDKMFLDLYGENASKGAKSKWMNELFRKLLIDNKE